MLETETEELVRLRRKFKAKLGKWLKLFDEFIPPTQFKEPKQSSLGGTPGRFEVYARQYFVGRVVRILSPEICQGQRQPPLRPKEYSTKELEEPHDCKWCGELVMPVKEDKCRTNPCPHAKKRGDCRGRCPFCPLPIDMWIRKPRKAV